MPSLVSFDKIKAKHFHSSKCFIDDLYNDGGQIGRSICEIYSKELELKVEHQDDYATFSNLDITIEEATFLYKLFNKRDSFPFPMSHIESNIFQNIFYSAIKGEF